MSAKQNIVFAPLMFALLHVHFPLKMALKKQNLKLPIISQIFLEDKVAFNL